MRPGPSALTSNGAADRADGLNTVTGIDTAFTPWFGVVLRSPVTRVNDNRGLGSGACRCHTRFTHVPRRPGLALKKSASPPVG